MSILDFETRQGGLLRAKGCEKRDISWHIGRKSWHLVESHPDRDSCRSSTIFYYVDGKRVTLLEYGRVRAFGLLGQGRLETSSPVKSKRGRWLCASTVYA